MSAAANKDNFHAIIAALRARVIAVQSSSSTAMGVSSVHVGVRVPEVEDGAKVRAVDAEKPAVETVENQQDEQQLLKLQLNVQENEKAMDQETSDWWGSDDDEEDILTL